MPGARPRGFYFGDSAELLAEFILGSMAFVTRVPRQEDVGYDLLCVLKEREGTDLFRAGAFFTVQVKNKREPITFGKDGKWWEVNWIKQQQNPYLICIADRATKTIELYSTWNMLNGFLLRAAHQIVLIPDGPDATYEYPRAKEAVGCDKTLSDSRG